VEQARTSCVVFRTAVGTVARVFLARETVRQLDQERQVSEKLCGRDIPVPVHAGARARRPGPVLARRRLRPGRQPAVSVQQGCRALCHDRGAEHGGLGTAVLLRQKQLPDVVLRPAVGLEAAEIAQPGILTVDRSQQSEFPPENARPTETIFNHRNVDDFQVPTLSQWFHDMSPFFPCCMWQEEQAVGCETYRFERRPSQDCVAYQSPYVGMCK